MDIITSLEIIKSTKKSILTISSFDGLHRGHQEIVKKVVSQAQMEQLKSVVITFDPHPRQRRGGACVGGRGSAYS